MLAGIVGQMSQGGYYSPETRAGIVDEMIAKLQVYPPDAARAVGNLSGGNQQKVLLGKWLATEPKVLILDEPTRGVDVGAKVVIHRAIAEAADSGAAVLLISSDLPELVALSNRVLILRNGRLIGQMDHTNCTEESVLLAANGQWEPLPA